MGRIRMNLPRQGFDGLAFLTDFLEKYEVACRGPADYDGGQRWILDACPFNPEHVGTSVAVGVTDVGHIWFKCQHNGCDGKAWTDFRQHYQPDWQPGPSRGASEVQFQGTVPTWNSTSAALSHGVDAADLREQDGAAAPDSLSLLGQDGYIIQGWSNLLAAYPRTGKTELAAACIPGWLTDGHPVLYLTEEPLDMWRLRLKMRESWPRGCRIVPALGVAPSELLSMAMASDEAIIVVDSIRNLLQFEDENNNSEVARKINPWVWSARQAKKTLQLVHHMRKGSGDHGEGIAGAHALLGAVDIALEVLRDQHGENVRRVRVWARVIQVPELLYQMDSSGKLSVIGDPRELDRNALEERLVTLFDDNPQARPTKELHAELAEPRPSVETVRQTLHDLAEDGYLERDPPLSEGAARGKTHLWRRTAQEFQSSVPTRKGALELNLGGARKSRQPLRAKVSGAPARTNGVLHVVDGPDVERFS